MIPFTGKRKPGRPRATPIAPVGQLRTLALLRRERTLISTENRHIVSEALSIEDTPAASSSVPHVSVCETPVPRRSYHSLFSEYAVSDSDDDMFGEMDVDQDYGIELFGEVDAIAKVELQGKKEAIKVDVVAKA